MSIFLSIISSSRITVVSPSFFDGICTTLGSTDGTCTVANRSSPVLSFLLSLSLFSFLEISAPIFNVLFLISGNGLEESIAIGVSTGYTLSSKYLSTNALCASVRFSWAATRCIPAFSSAGIRERFRVLYCT